MRIELTDEQKRNLLMMLQRVDLKGGEVPAYVDVMNALNKEIKEEKMEMIENAGK